MIANSTTLGLNFIGKCLIKLKLDMWICSSQDITIALCLVMTLALISFFCFFSSISMRLLVFHLEYCCILLWLIRLMNYLKMGWRLRPRSHENTWFSLKIKEVVLSYTYWCFKWFNTKMMMTLNDFKWWLKRTIQES